MPTRRRVLHRTNSTALHLSPIVLDLSHSVRERARNLPLNRVVVSRSQLYVEHVETAHEPHPRTFTVQTAGSANDPAQGSYVRPTERDWRGGRGSQ